MAISASPQFSDVISASATVTNTTGTVTWIVTLSGGGASNSVTIPPNTTSSVSLTATGLARGTSYTFSTSAVRADTGNVPNAFTAESTTATTYDYGATNISLSATSSRVTLNVTVQNTAVGASWNWFVRKTSDNTLITGRTGQPAGTTESSTVFDDEVSPGTTYTYRLSAINQSTLNPVIYFPASGYLDFSITTSSAPTPPPTPAPSFTDTTVADGVLGVSYSDGVSANNTSSYSIASGSLPSGLSLTTSTGAIAGTPTEQGSFTFAINASGGGGTTGSGNLTIQVLPPGNRRNDVGFDVNLANAKRYDGAAWVDLSTMKRFDGTNWVNISN
jgi:hypothetical protein